MHHSRSDRCSAETPMPPRHESTGRRRKSLRTDPAPSRRSAGRTRSEEHTSELQSLMRISYAVFFLKKIIHNFFVYHLITRNIFLYLPCTLHTMHLPHRCISL